MVVERIFVCPQRGAAQVECEQVELESGKGIVGDRHFGQGRYPGESVSLVEAEEIERFCGEQGRAVDLALTRRNLVTRGVRLNALVGSEFVVGEVRLRGIELCEPCSTLGARLADESFSAAAVVKRWLGCGGLLAEVLAPGVIERGATIRVDA